jgi:outer membrane receptor protein involved in Fe transport
LTLNSTKWTQGSGEAAGTAANGAWIVRGALGTQTYYQTFSAVLAGRRTERLTLEQDLPSDFGNASAQWTRGWGSNVLLLGADTKRTESTVSELRYSVLGVQSGPFLAGGTESDNALFGRVSTAPHENLTVVLGVRTDFWKSTPDASALPEHTATFISPRVSLGWRVSDTVSVHGSVYRGHRTPTLNELHRGFSVGSIVTNPNPELNPERLTGIEGGVLWSGRGLSARVTAFANELDDAITNVTISTVGAAITRQRQNTDSIHATGVEFEADLRLHPRWTVEALAAATHATFSNSPFQPALEGNRVPQVPSFQLGATLIYVDPHGFTGSVQGRVLGEQFDDDLNAFTLEGFTVLDASVSQQVMHGLHLFGAVENLFDTDYDVGRTPLRTIGWPRTVRVGVRVFLP